MQILDSNYLDDGKGFNKGQPASLLRVEDDADFDALVRDMAESGYYNGDYFKTHIGHGETLKSDSILLSCLIHQLLPEAVLDVGCGHGEILFLLALNGVKQVQGSDISPDAVAAAQPLVRDRIHVGDLLETCDQFLARGCRFDTLLGLDIWEHLHPGTLDASIEAVSRLARDDALFFFVIPAFGHDRVFGEVFPLEFEENRQCFEQRRPFNYLLLENKSPPIPASGHLLWAHTEWWEAQFQRHGLIREPVLERELHKAYDECLFYARQSFFILRKPLPASARRVERVLATRIRYWESARRLQRTARALVSHAGKTRDACVPWTQLRGYQWKCLLAAQTGLMDDVRRSMRRYRFLHSVEVLLRPALRLAFGILRRIVMRFWTRSVRSG